MRLSVDEISKARNDGVFMINFYVNVASVLVWLVSTYLLSLSLGERHAVYHHSFVGLESVD